MHLVGAGFVVTLTDTSYVSKIIVQVHGVIFTGPTHKIMLRTTLVPAVTYNPRAAAVPGILVCTRES